MVLSLRSDVGSLGDCNIATGRSILVHSEQTQPGRKIWFPVALQRCVPEPGDKEVHCELALSLGGHMAHSELAASLGYPQVRGHLTLSLEVTALHNEWSLSLCGGLNEKCLLQAQNLNS